MTYTEQLQHPLWQKKRLEILERDKYTCQICSATHLQLQIHHQHYQKNLYALAWEYPQTTYKTLCKDCHEAITEHIKEHGYNCNEFDVLRVTEGIFIYSKGILKIKLNDGIIEVSEQSSIKVVQFLINNWLKNG